MTFEDKLEDTARTYRLVDDFAARPLAGPGRWAEVPGGTLYTNDNNTLFIKDDGSGQARQMIYALDKAHGDGKTATQAFDYLRFGAAVTAGDLSELA